MNKKIIYLLILILSFSSNIYATDIMSNITSLPINASMTDYVFAYNNMLGFYPAFTIILAIMIVATISIYAWKQDIVESLLMGSLIATFIAFLSTIITSKGLVFISDGTQLLSFERFTFFAIILSLTAIYRQVSDR